MIALRRNPAPDEQDLNVPRCLFEALGIDVFQGLPFEQRVAVPRQGAEGDDAAAQELARANRARAAPRAASRSWSARSTRSSRAPPACASTSRARTARIPGWLDVTGIIAGTGFNKSALTLPLLRRLVEHYDVPIDDGPHQAAQPTAACPASTATDSRLCMMGLTANNVIPHGDTIAGLKYIGRRFVADCARAERPAQATRSRAACDAAVARARDAAGDPHRPAHGAARLAMCPTVLGRDRDAHRHPHRPRHPGRDPLAR